MLTLSPFEEVQAPSYDLLELSAININEEEKEYVLVATASGLRRENLHVCVEKKVLTIIANNQLDGAPVKKGDRSEVRYCPLPDNADPLLTCATYQNGSLEIHIPKGTNTEEKPLLIHVY